MRQIAKAMQTTVHLTACRRSSLVDTAYKDEIEWSLQPVADYVVGADDLYLCSPIPSEAGHYCVRLEQLSFDLSSVDPHTLGDGFLVFLLMLAIARLLALSLLSQKEQS